MNSRENSVSAVLPDGSLNFKVLEREISNDITSHERFRAEDEMKKRAIHISESIEGMNKHRVTLFDFLFFFKTIILSRLTRTLYISEMEYL